MNKRMKKAAAVLASAVLCLGISTTVLAAENPSVTDPTIPGGAGESTNPDNTPSIPTVSVGLGLDKDGNKVTVYSQPISQEIEETLKDENAVKNILKDAGYQVDNNQKVVVLGASDFKMVGNQPISGSADMTFPIGSNWSSNWNDVKDIKNGDTVYVLHQTADGTWEVLEGKAVVTKDAGGYTSVSVDVTMTGFSPVAFIKVMSNGEVVVLDRTETIVSQVEPTGSASTVTTEKTTSTVTTKTSPKTGEW
ncbi:MAG TPA: hypothetical protein H9722_06820 [Candidatus Mediterraneibacter pullistercoris]|nr:hypothetical protein [Candidatus Mediterraneibacter pullistercoris]